MNDISSKDFRIKDLEEKSRKMQVEYTTANTAHTTAEAQAALHKSLADSLEITLGTTNDTIF